MTVTHPHFTLITTQPLPDIHATGYLWRHNKTGAEVLHLATEDTHKAFCISFATPPTDDSGVAHIIEHSVLCGSRKYPSKEPFTELLKGSLHTFLNAMTYPDKTVYPVASQNDADFDNLMDVYLDAVFFPNLHHNPLILQQEGWHHHLPHIDDTLIYKGVVYNEMKGAFSSPETVLAHAVQQSLFPDTCYAFESGGLPEAIVSLNQETFSQFHRDYYHPSNALAVCYGKMDIVAKLSHLDSYFSQFERRSVPEAPLWQKPFEQPQQVRIQYAIAADEPKNKKTFLNMSFVTGDVGDVVNNMAFSILEEVLLGSNASPLRKALLASGLGSDVSGGLADYTRQSFFDITLKNADPEDAEAFQQLVRQTLRELVADGISEDLVAAAFNKFAFAIKEAENQGAFPKGVLYALNALPRWMHHHEPFAVFQYTDHLAAVEQAVANGILERLIQEKLLDNPHAIVLIAEPQPDLQRQKECAEAEALQAFRNTLSDADCAQLVTQTAQLETYQLSPDNPEDLEKIPLLTLSEVTPQAADYPLQQDCEHDITMLHYEAFTAGIDYVSYWFDMRGIVEQQLPYVGLLAQLLSNMRTERDDLDTLTNHINRYTGGLSFSTQVLPIDIQQQSYHVRLVVKGKSLNQHTAELLQLLHDIICHTRFDDLAKLKELLLKYKSRYEGQSVHHAHAIAMHRVYTYYSVAAQLEDVLYGRAFYQFVCDILANFEQRAMDVVDTLTTVAQQVFQRHHLVVGYTGSAKAYQVFRTLFADTARALPHCVVPEVTLTQQPAIRNEGFTTAQAVNYVAKGFNFRLLQYANSGVLAVLRTILSYDYLWNHIRVQGGAYGAFAAFRRTGDVVFGSYRDPNITETLTVFDAIPQYLSTFDVSVRELTKYILGTISTLDRPLTPSDQAHTAIVRYLTGITWDTLQKERTEVLHTTIADIRACAPLLAAVLSQDAYCVIGNRDQIQEVSEAFEQVTPLLPQEIHNTDRLSL